MQFKILFLSALAAATVKAYIPLTEGFPTTLDPLTASLCDINKHLYSNHITSEQLILEYFARIERNNVNGMNLRAVISTAPKDSILEIARSADAERKQAISEGKKLDPLHGVPILVKDNVGTDIELGMNTTAGSFALMPQLVGTSKDATIIRQLRKRGAIILAKANLSEFANYFSVTRPNGFSAVGGQTQSPYVLGGPSVPGGDPLGSSSGSGAGVAAGFAPISIGTETDGSIVMPASRAALYGLKPSIGLASRTGIVPLSHTQDSPGPMAKSVYDIAVMLGAVATTEADNADPENIEAVKKGGPLEDYTQFLTHSFHGIKIGVPSNTSILFSTVFDPLSNGTDNGEQANKTLEAISKMASLGATVVEDANIDSEEEAYSQDFTFENTVIDFDFKQDIAAYLSSLSNDTTSTPIRTLKQIIDFNSANKDLEGDKQDLLEGSQNTTNFDDPKYKEALVGRLDVGRQRGLDATFEKFGVDVLCVPTETGASRMAALAGFPIANVPLGVLPNGQPYGMSFLAKQFDEKSLIKVMSAYEANFPARPLPKPSVDDDNNRGGKMF